MVSLLISFPNFYVICISSDNRTTDKTNWNSLGVFLFLQKVNLAGIPPFRSRFCEQVSVHVRLFILAKIPAEFAATTCFRSSVYKLRGSIQRSKETLSQACQETKTERSLCTLFKAVAALFILFLITAHRAAASSKLVSLHQFKH